MEYDLFGILVGKYSMSGDSGLDSVIWFRDSEGLDSIIHVDTSNSKEIYTWSHTDSLFSVFRNGVRQFDVERIMDFDNQVLVEKRKGCANHRFYVSIFGSYHFMDFDDERHQIDSTFYFVDHNEKFTYYCTDAFTHLRLMQKERTNFYKSGEIKSHVKAYYEKGKFSLATQMTFNRGGALTYYFDWFPWIISLKHGLPYKTK